MFDKTAGGPRARPKRAVIISCTVAGSLGDQAMTDAAVSHLVDKAGYDVRIVPDAFETRRAIGGRYPSSRLGKMVNAFFEIVRADVVGFIGADVLDGVYGPAPVLSRLRLLELGHRTGARTRVFGASFSRTPSARIVSHLRKSRWLDLYAREPISRQRMTDATGRTAWGVADLAFQLEPEITSAAAIRASDWVAARRRGGGTILGVNLGGPALASGKTAAVDGMASALTGWLRTAPDRSVLMVPHDRRKGTIGDMGIMTALHEAMPADVRTRIHFVSEPIQAWDAKALAGQLDLVVASRMHFAVAALGMGVPVLCIVYQGKFEGLLRHFSLREQAMDPSVCARPAEVRSHLERTLADAPALRDRIAETLPQVMALSRSNFDGL